MNACRQAQCENFGIPVGATSQRGAPKKGQTPRRDRYQKRGATGKNAEDSAECLVCGSKFDLKSNFGIAEEMRRIKAYLEPLPPFGCGSASCPNYRVDPELFPESYQKFGKTAKGVQRYRCTGCKRTCLGRRAQPSPIQNQLTSYKNRTLFRQLINHQPIRRILDGLELGPGSLYGRIQFFERQCRNFMAEREAKLPQVGVDGRLYLSCDAQDYGVNWFSRKDRRSVQLEGTCIADNRSMYVFASIVNYDPAHKPADVNAEAERIGDLKKPRCYRRFARFWLENEYPEPPIVYSDKFVFPPSKPEDYSYDDLGADPDDDPPDIPARGWATGDDLFNSLLDFDPAELDPPRQIDFTKTATARSQQRVMPLNFVVGDPDTQFRRPPVQGMQVHEDYTLAGLFEYFRRRFSWVEKLRWCIDEDGKLRVALMGAFHKEILAGRCDVFFVQFEKALADWQRTQIAAQSREAIKAYAKTHRCSERDAIEWMLVDQIAAARGPKGSGLANTWIRHPLQTKDQPNKMIQMLTDVGQYDNAPGELDGDRHVARLMSMAGLKATDQFFLQIRYLIKPLSHQTLAASRTSRLWHPHNLFNPGYVQCLLTMFRAYYNYCKVGQDKMTPAMRLGLAEGPVDLAKIIGHRWND